MRQGSLKRRLLAAGAASVVLALALAGLGLLLLFERHVERRMAVELEAYLRQLAGGIERGPDGALQLAQEPAEPRFREPLGGLYWQVGIEPGGPVLRSRSLWDRVLELPPDEPAEGELHRHTIAGPGGASLLAVERTVVLPEGLGGGRARVAAAIDRAEVHAAGLAFARDLAPSLALLAALLVAGAWAQVTIGLRPLEAVRRRLGEVRAGRAARLGADFPDEVRPLAAEVDHLLEGQELALARARARAADLAHGLRTPLTVLAADAEELRARGEARLGEEIATVTDGIRRHVERELARARSGVRVRAGSPRPVRPVVEQVCAVLRRTPRGRRLAWQVAVAPDLAVRIDPEDLAEILGNLAENAVKWAAGHVRIAARNERGMLVLSVEDDGQGIPAEQTETVRARGGRLDEAEPGTGLGLAIVGDLAQAHGGSLALGRSDLGGLAAEVRLPSGCEGT
jgi:signal transduction histidine kinase